MYITNVSVKVIDDHSPILFLICEECQIASVLFTNVVFSRIASVFHCQYFMLCNIVTSCIVYVTMCKSLLQVIHSAA